MAERQNLDTVDPEDAAAAVIDYLERTVDLEVEQVEVQQAKKDLFLAHVKYADRDAIEQGVFTREQLRL